MTKRVLTQAQCGEIRRMRAEVDDWGEARWTGLAIAEAIGCSEGTVWRVLGRRAGYARAPSGLSMEAAAAAMVLSPAATGLDAEAQASAERMLERLRPASPLDGGEAETTPPSMLEKKALKMGLDLERLRSAGE